MNSRSRSNLALLWFLAGTISVVSADESGAELQVESCLVYSEQQNDLQFDCTEKAREICRDSSVCELPIGMNLTEGKDIDGNAETWELVKVEYSCAESERINGPHYQNDHATMTLFCRS